MGRKMAVAGYPPCLSLNTPVHRTKTRGKTTHLEHESLGMVFLLSMQADQSDHIRSRPDSLACDGAAGRSATRAAHW